MPRGNGRFRSEGELAFINLRSGIDVYAHWHGKTLADERAQITGHSLLHGHVGYLRESYDGEPYAIPVLVPEALDSEAEILAAILRGRLDKVLPVALRRQVQVYGRSADDEITKAALKSFVDFVELCERKETETGEPCRISGRS